MVLRGVKDVSRAGSRNWAVHTRLPGETELG